MRFDDPTNPLAWLVASFLAIILLGNAVWLVVRKDLGRAAFRRGPLAAFAWAALRLFYLLVPFVALQRGVLSPYALGLTEINWPATLSNGMVLAGLIAGGLLFGWLVYRRARSEEEMVDDGPTSDAFAGGPLPPALARLVATLRAPIDAALDQWHWAFYRAAFAGWLALPLALRGVSFADQVLQGLQAQGLYWGAWFGILLAGIEWAANPLARGGLSRADTREAALRRAALGVATTGLFVLTRNLWLCLAVQMAVETLAVGWFPLPGPTAAQVD